MKGRDRAARDIGAELTHGSLRINEPAGNIRKNAVVTGSVWRRVEANKQDYRKRIFRIKYTARALEIEK